MAVSDPYEHSMIAANGIRLHVVTAGDPAGRPVVLLHGFPEFWYGWRHQIPALAAAGLRVIVPDQRGYNLSDKPAGIRSYRIEALAGDVIGLLDHFGYDRAAVVGHDWGAAVAWELALAFPRRVDRLGVLNVPHPAVMGRFVRHSPPQMLRSWYIGFFQVPALPEGLLGLRGCALTVRLLVSSGNPGTFTPAELGRYREAWSRPGALKSMIHWYRAALRHPKPGPADMRVHVPTLMLWGKRDVALGAEMAQPSIDLCDAGRLVFFEKASHWVQHDEAGAVNRNLAAFLAGK